MMKKRKILMALLMLVIFTTTTLVFAVDVERPKITDLTTARVVIGKTLQPSAGEVYPDLSEFKFTLTPYSYTLASDGEIVKIADTATGDGVMPVTNDVTVEVSPDGTVKKGTNFFDLQFEDCEIGVYTYILREVPDHSYEGVVYDENTYYINIYVINVLDEEGIPTGDVMVANMTAWRNTNASDEALKGEEPDNPEGTWVKNEDGKVGGSGPVDPDPIDPGVDPDPDDPTGEWEHSYQVLKYPFVNTYSTVADLSVEKVVKGNYANVNQVFDFDVTLDNADEGTYAVEYYKDGQLVEGTLNGSPATVTGAATVKLKHGEKAVVKDLPSGATYTIVENQEATYTGEYTVDGKEADGPVSGQAEMGENLTAQGTLADNGVVKGVLADEVVVFTNTKEYIVPTGIILNVLPYAAGFIVVASMLVVVSKKRKQVEE